MTPLQKAARWYADRLTTGKRSSDGSEYVHFADYLPQYEQNACRALARAAHDDGSILPDDWRYEFISEALNALADEEDPDDIHLEADIYTGELLAWVASRNDRLSYCDEAYNDYGMTSTESTTETRLQLGQIREKEEVLAAVRAYLEKEIEAEDTDSEEVTT